MLQVSIGKVAFVSSPQLVSSMLAALSGVGASPEDTAGEARKSES